MNNMPLNNPSHLTHPKYRADIDGLRAVAILSVVGFHAFPLWLKGGFVGVDVFFVISGFLISTIIIGSLERNSFSFIEFYSRRINRIFPALLLVLFTCFIFGWFVLLADEYKHLGKHIVGGAGFISNYLLWYENGYFDITADIKPLLHLWSLGIEEQFYIVWPVLLWVAWKKRFNLLMVLIAVTLISFSLNISSVADDAVATFYSPLTRFWELFLGSFLAYITLHKQNVFNGLACRFDEWVTKIFRTQTSGEKGNILPNTQSILGAVLIIISVIFTPKDNFPGWWAVLPTLGTMLIISAGAQGWVNRVVLSNGVLVWFGLVSFPLYLWHWPLLSFSRIVYGEIPDSTIRIAMVFISILLAWLTYSLIEKPLRFRKDSKVIVIILLVLMSIVGCLGYSAYESDGFEQRNVELENFNPDRNIIIQSNQPSSCSNEKKYALVNKFCTKYASENAQKTIVLYGDSSSGAWVSVFLGIAKSNEYTVILVTMPACSPLNIKPDFKDLVSGDLASDDSKYCGQGKIQGQAIELFKTIKPDMIVVMAAWNWNKIQCEHDEKTVLKRSNRTLDRNIRNNVKEFEKISKLVIFRSWPLLTQEPNYKISRIPLLKIDHEMTTVDANEFINDNKCMNDIFDGVTVKNTLFFNPAKKVCSEKCVSILNGTRMYIDAYHISPHGSMKFRSELEKIIESN